MQRFKKIELMTYFMLICVLTSCGSTPRLEDLKLYVADMKQKQQTTEEEHIVAELKKPVPAVYSAKNLRIPFGETAALVNKTVSTNPLLAVPLSMLRFTGTVLQGKTIHAFILAPDNKVYSVFVGDKLGDREDEIMHIYPNKIELMEHTAQGEKGKIITLELNKGSQ